MTKIKVKPHNKTYAGQLHGLDELGNVLVSYLGHNFQHPPEEVVVTISFKTTTDRFDAHGDVFEGKVKRTATLKDGAFQFSEAGFTLMIPPDRNGNFSFPRRSPRYTQK